MSHAKKPKQKTQPVFRSPSTRAIAPARVLVDSKQLTAHIQRIETRMSGHTPAQVTQTVQQRAPEPTVQQPPARAEQPKTSHTRTASQILHQVGISPPRYMRYTSSETGPKAS